MIAVVPLPGMPRTIVGTIATAGGRIVGRLGTGDAFNRPPCRIPRGFSNQRRASEYPIIEATVAPSAGRIPIKVPIPDERAMVFQIFL